MRRIDRRTILAAVACLMAGGAQAQMRDLAIPISSTSFGTAAIRVAKELGLFEKQGINARFVTMDSSSAAMTALISGSSEVVLSGPGEMIAARARNQPIVAVVDCYRGFAAALVLRKDIAEKFASAAAGPPAAKLKALDGLTIASPSATSAYTVAFRGAADAQGAKIKFTYMAQPTMAAALAAKAIDGYIAGAPFWGEPVTRGTGALWLSGPRGDLPPQNMPYSSVSLQVMKAFADANLPLMKSLQAVLADLGATIDKNPGAVKAAVRKLYPELDEAAVDLYLTTEMQAWKTRPFTATDFRQEIDFVKSTGADLPNVDSIDPASLFVPVQ